ncbi:MAG: DUF807 family protein [Candidatus Aquirickettsiella sp.]
MLNAYLSFNGSTGQLLNYLGNNKAIEAPQIVRTAAGSYTITFLTGRQIDASTIGASIVTVQCQSPAGSGTVTNVLASPQAVYNPNSIEYPWSISFKIETQNVVPALLILGTVLNYVDRPLVMVAFQAKNTNTLQTSKTKGGLEILR